MKPKDLVGIPWRVAFALQADGWYLRQDIIWHKPNPMPESVTDRPTRSHEYLFLLAKSAKYHYDQAAGANVSPSGNALCNSVMVTATRNRRSVWTIATQRFPEAHFATFPEKLVEPCILAGTSEKGCCPACGAPWTRTLERTEDIDESARGSRFDAGKTGSRDGGGRTQKGERYRTISTGWQAGCACDAGDPVPCLVLDPFSGAGTTGVVCVKTGRRYVGIELNPEYVAMSERRIRRAQAQGVQLQIPST